MLAAFIRVFSTDPLPHLAEELNHTDPASFLKGLRVKLNLSDSFWDGHCSFRSGPLIHKAAVLGKDRAETLLIDVFVPSLLAFAKLNGDSALERKALELPLLIKAQKNNRVFKNAVRRWLPDDDPRLDIFDNAAAIQGCLHIYKQYCADTAGDCTTCLLAGSAV